MTNPETIAAYIADLRRIGCELQVGATGYGIEMAGVDGMDLLEISRRYGDDAKADPAFNQKVRAALLAEDQERRLTPAKIRTALIRPADPDTASPDARLLSLRDALLDAWEEERRLFAAGNPEWEGAADGAEHLVNQMAEMRAQTIEGLQAKAIAVAHCHHGEDVILADHQTTDIRLAQSILADLLP